MMKISNKVDEIRIEDVSANIAVSCIYMMKNLYNGKIYKKSFGCDSSIIELLDIIIR